MRIPSLLLIAGALAAVDGPIAQWTSGPASVAGAALSDGGAIADGAEISVGDGRGALRIAGTGCTLVLGAGARIALRDAGEQRLVIDLRGGAVEARLGDRGPWLVVVLEGARVAVVPTGTLFVAERTRQDADHVALVEGRVAVSLRTAVAEQVRKEQSVELEPRQGVIAGAGGLGAVFALSGMPTVPASITASSSIFAPESLSPWDDEGAPPIDPDALAESIVDGITDQIVENIAEQVTTEVMDSAFGLGGAIPLPPVPPPVN